VRLEFHYRETIRRLVFSIQHLNGLMQKMSAGFDKQLVIGQMSLMLEAGCQADHILTYLNSIVDDIACAIIRSTGFASLKPADPIDSISRLKKFAGNAALAPVSTLLGELDKAGSWWELAFKPKVGGRQLLIHNHHYVSFQGCKVEDRPYEAEAFVMTPLAQTPMARFFDLLRSIFADLFNWLDRLELALIAPLQARSSAWLPDARCPSFTLPVGYPPGTTKLIADYFVLPLCDGSDPLPWITTVQMDEIPQPTYCLSAT
jgi:hypothetical protein